MLSKIHLWLLRDKRPEHKRSRFLYDAPQMGPRGPHRGNAAYIERRVVAGGVGATDNAEMIKALVRISRTSEASGTRPRQTCDTQAEGAPGPHGIDVMHRWRGEGLRGREARTRLLSRIDGERHRCQCARTHIWISMDVIGQV